MAEYIEREAVLARACYVPGFFCSMISSWDVVHLPTADVEPVVRCKDCIFRDGLPGQPNILCGQMKDNDFCSYGERRDSV